MTTSIKIQAINLIEGFNPLSGPLFDSTDGGFELLMQQSEQYISGVSKDVLSEAARIIGRISRLNEQRKFKRNVDSIILLEGAILDALK